MHHQHMATVPNRRLERLDQRPIVRVLAGYPEVPHAGNHHAQRPALRMFHRRLGVLYDLCEVVRVRLVDKAQIPFARIVVPVVSLQLVDKFSQLFAPQCKMLERRAYRVRIRLALAISVVVVNVPGAQHNLGVRRSPLHLPDVPRRGLVDAHPRRLQPPQILPRAAVVVMVAQIHRQNAAHNVTTSPSTTAFSRSPRLRNGMSST